MVRSTEPIKLPRYIVQRIISLLSNPDRNNLECLEEAQALRRALQDADKRT